MPIILLRLIHGVVGDVGGDGFVVWAIEQVGRWAEWVLVVFDGCPTHKHFAIGGTYFGAWHTERLTRCVAMGSFFIGEYHAIGNPCDTEGIRLLLWNDVNLYVALYVTDSEDGTAIGKVAFYAILIYLNHCIV